MADDDIHAQINKLVDTEHQLRRRQQAGEPISQADRTTLRETEEKLDQLWDLLRQRQARREFGEDPADTETRPTSTVEGYLN